jgi:predicted RNA-binding protein YlxR (DUF448 family)
MNPGHALFKHAAITIAAKGVPPGRLSWLTKNTSSAREAKSWRARKRKKSSGKLLDDLEQSLHWERLAERADRAQFASALFGLAVAADDNDG